jgi:Ca2+-binding RTX toxin-like protein
VVSFLDSDTATVLDLGNPAASHNSITHVEVFYLTEHGDVFSAAGAPLPDSGVGFFIYGFAGDDTIIGSSGSDFIDPGAGANTIDGGAGGFDYLSYYTAPHGIRLDLKNPASNTGNAAGDTIRNIDAYVLTPFDDVFVGADSGQNIVFGYEGNDTFIGGFNANNWFFGGPGNDRMVGGGVQDLYALGAGASTLVPITPAPLAGSSVFGFKPGVDRIEISRAAFGLGTGYAVSAGTTFVTGTLTAQPVVATAQPAFIYYTDLGMLYFDPDGSGGTAAKLLLQFAGSPSLAAGDFVLV